MEKTVFTPEYGVLLDVLKRTRRKAGITQVELGGVRPFEISIEISEERLRQYHLTLEQVASKIRNASLDLPGGSVKTAGGEILLRTKERRYFGPEYADIVILSSPDGTQVKLSEIARVVDGFADTDEFAHFDGSPAANDDGSIECRHRLGGLLRYYHREAG